jgi:hypothetical protein
MKAKELTNFPDYAKIRQAAVDKLRAEEQTINARLEEIGVELTKPTQRINGEDAWSLALQGGNAPAEIDAKSSLREEFQLLEGRLKFIREALDTGVLELDRVHGRASLEICKEVRPQFTKQIESCWAESGQSAKRMRTWRLCAAISSGTASEAVRYLLARSVLVVVGAMNLADALQIFCATSPIITLSSPAPRARQSGRSSRSLMPRWEHSSNRRNYDNGQSSRTA